MARFTAGGDAGGNERRPSNNRPFPKRPRLSNPSSNTPRRPNSPDRANASAVSTSNSPDRANASTSAAPQPPVEIEVQLEEPVAAAEESEVESVEESDTSWSDSSSGSEEESDEQEEEEQNQRSGDEVQPAEAPVESTPNGNATWEGSSGPVPVTLMDPDVLDCPICFQPLCSPVYQCENGHIACASCCTRMRNKCGNCRRPIGYNRCRAIEKVLESVRVACRNMPHGCLETLSYSKKLAHEKTCNYAPCSCPHFGCDYVGMFKFLYTHFAQRHSQTSKQFLFNSVISISLDNNQKHVFLQERSQSVLFVLNRSIESLGSFVDVVCVAPTSTKRTFLYDLRATVGESSIQLKSCAECVPKWTAQAPAKKYLLVPSDFFNRSGQLKLELIIWRDPALAS